MILKSVKRFKKLLVILRLLFFKFRMDGKPHYKVCTARE